MSQLLGQYWSNVTVVRAVLKQGHSCQGNIEAMLQLSGQYIKYVKTAHTSYKRAMLLLVSHVGVTDVDTHLLCHNETSRSQHNYSEI